MKKALRKKVAPGFYQDDIIQVVPTLTDLDRRFRIMDFHEPYMQYLTIGSPPVENVLGPQDAVELSMMANDELAGLVSKYPDRFIAGAACLPLNDVDASLKEIDRAIGELGLKGIQVFTDINGRPLDAPDFLPIFEKMALYDLPILLHPRRLRSVPDYPGEDCSKHVVFSTFGWPYETTVAMHRLVFSGMFVRFPNLKVVTHHCGGMVPYFEQRIATFQDFGKLLLNIDYGDQFTKSWLDYYRMFYCDTAVNGSTPALMCAYAFFPVDRMLFGTDMPYDSETGYRYVRETIRSVERMEVPDEEKKKIFADNARALLRIAAR
jgi:predicted TIM-barrel fold metal-dependent hydrolase